MIEYSDASDYFYVWLRRVLVDVQPELFAHTIGIEVAPDLQNKDDEIIVRRVCNGGAAPWPPRAGWGGAVRRGRTRSSCAASSTPRRAAARTD
jgi:hypothetical protein